MKYHDSIRIQYNDQVITGKSTDSLGPDEIEREKKNTFDPCTVVSGIV